VVKEQLEAALSGLLIEDGEGIVIAYEPVWAIGRAGPRPRGRCCDAPLHQGHACGALWRRRGRSAAHTLRGSVKPENAASLLRQPEIDGALIGGASLEIESFLQIARRS